MAIQVFSLRCHKAAADTPRCDAAGRLIHKLVCNDQGQPESNLPNDGPGDCMPRRQQMMAHLTVTWRVTVMGMARARLRSSLKVSRRVMQMGVGMWIGRLRVMLTLQ